MPVPPRLAYIGAFRMDYPRNQVLRAGLAAHGCEVISAPLSKQGSTLRNVPRLWQTMRRTHADVYLLAEFNQLLAPFALIMGSLLRRPVWVDYMVGLYDAQILDREAAGAHGWRGRTYRAVDAFNLRYARRIFTDTEAHKAFFAQHFGAAAQRLAVVPVGVYDAWWSPRVQPVGKVADQCLVQFFGSYIPFHGVEVILAAAKQLADMPHLHFELIGRGQTFAAIQRHAEQLALPNLTFTPPIPSSELPAAVARADICLGVFGERAKTDYVVPNKVFQCLALGKPLITARSTALTAYFRPDEHLISIPPNDPEALAAALRTLATDSALRERLGSAAAAHVAAHYTPSAVVAELLAGLR
ncbi:MAG: glycosyltransferase [Chloroflexi bacterium CFX4]|nr:glycosyltransferase [Chloroflexi bacterium CFX4]MDL1922472.1 glycosyltransferase family 4 protein [Chloroflexi bacterium CFX3]